MFRDRTNNPMEVMKAMKRRTMCHECDTHCELHALCSTDTYSTTDSIPLRWCKNKLNWEGGKRFKDYLGHFNLLFPTRDRGSCSC